jgi:hypothetical protein
VTEGLAVTLLPANDCRRLLADGERLVGGEWPARQALGQRLPRHQLHDEEARAVHLVEAMDGGEVGVVERRQQAGLALEAGQPLRVMSTAAAQDFDGDRAVEFDVAGAEDPAHAARSEGAEDLVRAKPGPWGQLHRRCPSVPEPAGPAGTRTKDRVRLASVLAAGWPPAARGSPRQQRGGSGCASPRRRPRSARTSTLHHVSTMSSLLEWLDRSCPRYLTGKPDGSDTEHQAGLALPAAISEPPLLLLSSMRNGERNHATPFLAFSGRGARRCGAGAGGGPPSGLRPQQPGFPAELEADAHADEPSV